MKQRTTYTQIMSQIDALKKQAEDVRREEVKGVIAKIKEAIAAYGLTAADLGFVKRTAASTRVAPTGARRSIRTGKPKAVRYRDDKGNTWVGLGKRPRWLAEALAAGRQLSDFAVK